MAVAETAVLLDLDQLTGADWNANVTPTRTLAKIRRSIERFGFVENLVARPHPTLAGKYEVISGNHRLELCREMAINPVPVVVRDYDDVEARLLAEAINNLGGEHDPKRYAQLLEDVLAGAGSAAQCVWTDPPYGVNYVGKTKDALTIKNDHTDGLRALLDAAFANVAAVLEPGAPFYIATPAGPQHTEFLGAIAGAGLRLHETLVWVKDVMVLGHADYHYQHEPILYGWSKGPGRSGRGNHKGSRWYGDNSQTTVFEIPRPKRSEEHPTMKPVELIKAMLLNSSTRGDAVLDPFAGSGSALIAADTIGRRCFALELDPGYCDVIRRRYETFVGGR